jgi:hypothetical protein
MRVIWRNSVNGFFYGGADWWVRGAERAHDLETIERAVEVGRAAGLERVEVVAWMGNPARELVLPLARPRTPSINALFAVALMAESPQPGQGSHGAAVPLVP